MGLGIGWLAITFFGARTGCPRCKKWFAGHEVTKLPANGRTLSQVGSDVPSSKFDITYKCMFCGNIWFKRA
jgi:hypothetical protein